MLRPMMHALPPTCRRSLLRMAIVRQQSLLKVSTAMNSKALHECYNVQMRKCSVGPSGRWHLDCRLFSCQWALF